MSAELLPVVESRTIIRVDDFYIDADTGEVLGMMEPAERFHVHDQHSAEWVLSKRFDIEARKYALERQKAALIANMDVLIAEQDARLKWLDMRFAGELRDWAAQMLAGLKTRTLKTPFGRLSFRKTPAKITVVDADKALEWAWEHHPQAVKTSHRFLISEVTLPTEALPAGIFESVPEGETFTINTSVGKE
jgi:hypothetical protein